MGKALTMIGVHKEPAYPPVHRQNDWFMGMDFCTHKKKMMVGNIGEIYLA